MTYPSTTLRTKKKSSDADWPTVLSIVGILGLFAVLTFAFRAVTMPARYAFVPAEIPVVPATVEDPSFHNFEEESVKSIRQHTPTLVMTVKAFYFGDMESFSSGIDKTNNKYIVPHTDNIPRVGDLITDMNAWREGRKRKENLPDEQILVFVPSGDIPMPIVVQVLAQLREFGNFQRVVLGGGFAF